MITPVMENDFSADTPVLLQQQDRFQRYNFSKGIASAIVNRQNNDSVVIGLYGAWGEGKTSVLNFISNELKQNPSILQLSFNPWRFADEEVLIKSFFQKIAVILKQELNTDKEKFGKLMEQFGKVGKPFGWDLADVGKMLASVNIETLKERIDSFLKLSTKKLVITIDDIDRLDKQEIFYLFKLIKLNANFLNTTYILSFDENMVAASLGTRYGNGDAVSGFNFLEKIIQVPLTIPQAPLAALEEYFFNLVDDVLIKCKIEVTTQEINRFRNLFQRYIFLRLKTPRMAIRYANAVSFALSLLKGEVNTIDLMIVEAIKIFYPQHYEHIKHNYNFFLKGDIFGDITDGTDGTYGKSELEKNVNPSSEHLQGLSEQEKQAAKFLLINLFPAIKIKEDWHFNEPKPVDPDKEKRIASVHYFKRYFSYSVLKGEISDLEFTVFLNQLNENDIDTTTQKLRDLISRASSESFLMKARSVDFNFSYKALENLSVAIGKSPDLFPVSNKAGIFGARDLNSQAAACVSNFLAAHADIDESAAIASKLLTHPVHFSFSWELIANIKYGKTQFPDYPQNTVQNLFTELIERAKYIAQNSTLFEFFPNEFLGLASIWAEVGKNRLKDYISQILQNDPFKIDKLLICICPTVISTDRSEPYKGGFSKEEFEFCKATFDIHLFYKCIIRNYSEKLGSDREVSVDRLAIQNEVRVLNEFMHWYNLDVVDRIP